MNDALAQNNHAIMEKALDQLKTGKLGQALVKFTELANQTPATNFTIPGWQMAGVTLRHIGEYESSITYLRTALSLSEKSMDALLRAAILRDLGISLYAEALRLKRDRSLIKEAYNCLLDSEAMLEKAMAICDQNGESFVLLDVELCATLSYSAIIRFETGNTDARHDLADIHVRLVYRGNEFRGHQFDNLVRLIRASPLVQRLRFYPLAVKLAKKAPQPRRALQKVRAALFGTKVYRRVTKNGYWK